MRAVLLFMSVLITVSCQAEQKVSNKKTSSKGGSEDHSLPPESADQTPSATKSSDLGCDDATVVGWNIYDSAGEKQPVCTLLSESSAKVAVLLPVDYSCDTCLDQVVAAQAELKKQTGMTIAMVARAGTTHPQALALLAASGDEKALLYIDTDGHFEERLKARGFAWNDPVFYAFSAQAGLYVRFDAPTYIDRLKTFFKLLTPGSESLFVWDGLSNQGHGEWVIE